MFKIRPANAATLAKLFFDPLNTPVTSSQSNTFIRLSHSFADKLLRRIFGIDEIEKLGGSNRNGDLRTSLLGLFAPRRAKAYLDHFLEVPIDYSRINWLATANETTGLPAPLLNRMRILKCPMPQADHLEALVPQLMKADLAGRGLDLRWYQPLIHRHKVSLKQGDTPFATRFNHDKTKCLWPNAACCLAKHVSDKLSRMENLSETGRSVKAPR